MDCHDVNEVEEVLPHASVLIPFLDDPGGEAEFFQACKGSLRGGWHVSILTLPRPRVKKNLSDFGTFRLPTSESVLVYPAMSNQWITLLDAARRTGTDIRTIYNWRKRFKIAERYADGKVHLSRVGVDTAAKRSSRKGTQ